MGKGEKELAPGQKSESFGAFDVFADGRIAHAPEDFESRGLATLFYKLPADNAPAQAGWETKKESDKSFYRLSPQSDRASGELVFERTDQSIFNDQ
ncbi:MAG TPA: hypothetical protein VFA77_03775 [Candidatus Eisenbacteria bacterium]|nr:hypothetical protein [Candidatus Eisenbacteria bacterium]